MAMKMERENENDTLLNAAAAIASVSPNSGNGMTPGNSSENVYETIRDNEGEDDETQSQQTLWSLFSLVVVAASTAATLGYDVGIMAAAIQPLETTMNLSSLQKEVAMGSLNFVAALGAALGGRVSVNYGRKPTVSVCAWLFVVGTVLMAGAPTYAILVLGRIVTGLGVGVSFVVAPVYLSEVAPTHLRGQLNTVFDVAINSGILLGYVVGFCVQVLLQDQSQGLRWRLMLGLGLVLPVVVLVNLYKLPESPRWLVMNQDTTNATKVLHQLGESPRQAQRTIQAIQDEWQHEQQMMRQPQSSSSCWKLSPGIRLALGLGFWQQITGTEAVLYYSADFLKNAGLESATQRLLGNCAVGLSKLFPELLAMQVVDHYGRRPLILISALSLMLTTYGLAAAFHYESAPATVVILLCAIMGSFSIGLGPFSFLVASENLSLAERSQGVTYCAAINRCTSGIVALTAVSMFEALGSAGLFATYATVGALSLPFYWTSVHETSGQTLEELAARRRQAADPVPNEHQPSGLSPVFNDDPSGGSDGCELKTVPGGTMA